MSEERYELGQSLKLIALKDMNGVQRIHIVDPQAQEFVEHVEEKVCVKKRPDFDTYFLYIALVVSLRADCRRAQHGCVITSGNRIVATGYNGSPSGGGSCLAGECPRGLLSNEECASLSSYENCIALHAEQNAIAYANRSDCVDATLYVTGPQCDMCRKLTIAAGIRRVVWPDGQLWV